MADSAAPWAAPGPSAPPTRPPSFGSGPAASASTRAMPVPIRPLVPPQPVAAAKPARRSGTRPIPLRPLSVLEVVDAGVGSLRSSPRRVHITALLVTIGICLLGFACLLFFRARLQTDIRLGNHVTTDWLGDQVDYVGVAGTATEFGEFLTDALFIIVFSGMAATFTTGLYTTCAQRYVDGLPPDADAARAGYRGRIGAMILLTVLISIPRLIMLALSVLITLTTVDNPNGGPYVALLLIGGPICFVLTALFAVALPALILERIAPRKAARRTRKLAQGGVWRSGWTCLFTLLITYTPLIVMAVFVWINREQNGGTGSFISDFSTINFILAAFVVVLTVPLRASTATMLYVDRRFRREGLDVRIAWARVAKETL